MPLVQPVAAVADAGLRPDSAERRYPVEFTAAAGAYFRIWIVNLALTVLTLGIYSAWAKVRKRRYFYSHTRIDGEGFEYRANPIAILKGRLIAVAILVAFSALDYFAPLYKFILWIPLIIFGPWLVVRSLAFNAYNTAYRNVRLRFDGTYKTCLKLVLGYGLLTMVTLGFGFPFLKRRLVQFAMENHSYGTTRFDLADSFKKPFIRPYILVYFAGVLFFVALIGVGFLMAALGERAKSGAEIPQSMYVLLFAGIVLFYAAMFALLAYLKARTTNAVWNHLAVGPVRFECSLRTRDLIWIYFSNFFVVALTLGLAVPWAVVRAARYRALKMTLVAAGPLDSYAQAQAQQLGATGEEVGEMLDIDIAL